MKTCTQCRMRYPNEATFCFVEGGALLPLPDPRIGTLLAGRYVIEEVIGEGGMATVYRARHKLIDRPVAVKIMNPFLASDPIVRERFRREARNAQKLAHPNIIEIHDQGDTEDGTAYIVMELLRGASLASVIQHGPIDVDRALPLMAEMARGIARAHDLDVIHRDLKPENIFLVRGDDESEHAKVLDFGIAQSREDSRLTTQGELFGTPQYMAPERIMGSECEGASDIYALGVVFFELLTGQLPFDAADVTTFFVKHMEEPPPPLRSLDARIPAVLDDLVLRMLAKSAADRPADGHRILSDLLAIIRDRELTAPPTLDEPPVSASPITLAQVVENPWARRMTVLEQMLQRTYGKKDDAPEALRALLDEATRLVRRIGALRRDAFESQEELETIELRGRDKRAQLGHAVDQLGVDASRAREEARSTRDARQQAENVTTMRRASYAAAHRDALYWEGRSGLAEPLSDLSYAYRSMADAVDAWRVAKNDERRHNELVESTERTVQDIDFQIRELRAALATHEEELDQRSASCLERIVREGNEADQLENDLFALTTRFCAPLRTRPELVTLFRELETPAA